MHKTLVLDRNTTKGHVFFLYNNDSERFRVLADYFKQGLENNELCIFVTHDSQQQVIEMFKAVDFDIAVSLKNKALLIFDMNETYLPSGQFVADYMLSNVNGFLEDAKAKGFNGLRTAGEMSWLNDHDEALLEAKHYEHSVNELNELEHDFVGLCLYPAEQTAPTIIASAAHSHPKVLYDDAIKTNPHYAT